MRHFLYLLNQRSKRPFIPLYNIHDNCPNRQYNKSSPFLPLSNQLEHPGWVFYEVPGLQLHSREHDFRVFGLYSELPVNNHVSRGPCILFHFPLPDASHEYLSKMEGQDDTRGPEN